MVLPLTSLSSSSSSLLPPPLHHTLCTLPQRSNRSRTNRQKSPKPNQLLLSYPKSSPTPVHLPRKRLTRDETLNKILLDLESNPPLLTSSLLHSLLICIPKQNPNSRLLQIRRLRRIVSTAFLRNNPGIACKFLHLHAALGDLSAAHHLFDQMPYWAKSARPFAWNTLVGAYADRGMHEDALALYYQMEEDGVARDRHTFPRALKACAGVGDVRLGEAVHRDAVRAGFGLDVFVLNALVDMYAKCGDVARAKGVFNEMSSKDSVSWNAMISGYFRHGLWMHALEVWREMIKDGLEPDSVALSTMLSRIASLPCGENIGLEIHAWAVRHGLEEALSVWNALIGMYSEKGDLRRARLVFESMAERDLVSWNAIISAHRRDYRVLEMFRQMVNSGMRPNGVTFVSLLSACANLGMVETGSRLFTEMKGKYKIRPKMEHYGCMVNMLGRAGMVEEALELVSKRMPFDGGPTVWGALLFACSMHGNVKVGEIAAKKLFELEPDNEHNFELLMKIYENEGRMEMVEKVKDMMRDRGFEVVESNDRKSSLVELLDPASLREKGAPCERIANLL